MTENDIYNSKEKYEKFKVNLELFALKPEFRKQDRGKKLKYYCKNPKNLEYFKKKGNLIYLKAANRNYSPIYPQYDLKVAAIVRGVIRKY